jgi:hypothetical protein
VIVDKSRSRRFPWLFGLLALSLTVPVVAGGLRGRQSDQAQPAGQGAAAAQGRGQVPPTTQPPGQRGGVQPDSRRPEFEWWNEAKKELGLTDAKAKEIDRIFQERARHAKPFFDQWRTEFDIQAKMAKERTVDDVTFALQVSRVDSLSSELRKSRAVMYYRMLKKLNAEQIKKLEEIRDRRERDGRGRGAGSR